jgi:plasmid stability protein
MAALTIRGLDDETRARLRVRAAHNGRSMEAEVRAILNDLLAAPLASHGLGSRIHERFRAAEGGDLSTPARDEAPRAATFKP